MNRTNGDVTKLLRQCFLIFIAFTALSGPLNAAERIRGKTETLACRLGTEDRHARIAVVLVGGKMTEFAYYSKWKPRTCSVHVQRARDSHSKWSDNGPLTTVTLAEGKGDFLIKHEKNGTYRLDFRGIDRERYCGMEGKINGHLIIKKSSSECELAGIMEEGTLLGQANIPEREQEATVKEDAATRGAAPTATAATAASGAVPAAATEKQIAGPAATPPGASY